MRSSIIYLCLSLFLSMHVGYSQTFEQKLQEQRDNASITELQALYIRALRSFARDRLPEAYRVLPDLPLKSATGLWARVRQRWEEFSPQQKAVLEPMLYRPRLQKRYTSPSGMFKIHYDTTGSNAVSLEDYDYSGISDYIEEVASSFEYAYSVEIGQLGLNIPPEDKSDHGPEWNIYIKDISDYGYTSFDPDPDDPNAWITYITMDNDYTHTPTEGLDGVRVTAAHEFFHMIQFGYNFRYDDIFLMEAGATWMEDVVYDYVNDYVNYLSAFFDRTNVSFDHADGWREYGLCLWFHFLEMRLGSRDIVRLTWEQIVRYPAVRATDMALRQLGYTFEEELALFYGWNYMTGSRADANRFYPEGDVYPMMVLDDSFVFGQDTSFMASIHPMASRYFQVETGQGASYTIIPTNVYRSSDFTTETCAIELIQGDENPFYTSLGYGMLTRIVSEDEMPWRGVAVTEFIGQETAFIPFAEADSGSAGSVSGIVWEDVNADRIRNADETGIPDVFIRLVEAGADTTLGTSDDVPFSARATDESGVFSFQAIYSGKYRVELDESTIPAGYISTTVNNPIDLRLDRNEQYEGADFGYRSLDSEYLPAAIPNPFVEGEYAESRVRIPFRIDESATVRIVIFSASGYSVMEDKVDYASSGIQMYSWDLMDKDHHPAPSGVYVYIVTSGSRLIRKEKFALVR